MRFKTSILTTVIALSGVAHAAVEVPNDPEHVIQGTVTGTLIAIDVPTLALPQNFTPDLPGGPIWVTGTPAGTIAHDADNGFYVQTTVGDDYTTRGPHNRAPWEPDGTPLAEGGHYGAYNGADPEVSYLFNLADSGIDIPDGAVINAVYTTWNTRGVDNADYSFAEGMDSGMVNVQFRTAPIDDLVLRWFDDSGTGHDANFQRIIEGPITVAGGDGFKLEVFRQPNTAHIDAVVIDVTGAGAASAPFAITEIEYDPGANEVTLTWRDSGAASYSAFLSPDLGDWGQELDDSITAENDERPEDSEHITVTFPLEGDSADAQELFFRMQEGG